MCTACANSACVIFLSFRQYAILNPNVPGNPFDAQIIFVKGLAFFFERAMISRIVNLLEVM